MLNNNMFAKQRTMNYWLVPKKNLMGLIMNLLFCLIGGEGE